MEMKINFLCRDSILAAPIVLDLALLMDLAQRLGQRGAQEWLGFYFKSPMTLPNRRPVHNLFDQLAVLKTTLAKFAAAAEETPLRRAVGA